MSVGIPLGCKSFSSQIFLCVFCPTFFALYCLEEQTQVLLGTVLV